MSEGVIIGCIGLFVMVVLMFLRMPIGFAMGIIGFFGTWYLLDLGSAVSLLGIVPYHTVNNYVFTVIPLFMFMGHIAFYSGMSGDIYAAAYKWLNRLPGGLAVGTVWACAGFSAMCGSTMATAVTIGTVAIPEMRERHYDPGLATGCVVAGGTLGIMIPPSMAFIIYGYLTETSIGKLFIAGILPGILLSTLFMLVIFILVKHNPRMAPASPSVSWRERISSLRGTWGMLVLAGVIIGGIYAGIFTPNEAAGAGAFVAILLALSKKGLTWQRMSTALIETIRSTAMVITILIGAMIFAYFMSITKLPFELVAWINDISVSRYVVYFFICLLYLVSGCLMDMMAVEIITLPIIFPVIVALGFDPIWFGVIMTVLIEQSGLTPPVGINVFVIHGVAKDVPMGTIFRGIIPFWFAMMVAILLMTFFPQIAIFLPGTM